MNSIKFLKEFNSHLRNEIHELKTEKSVLNGEILELKDKLEAEEKKCNGFFKDMIEAELKCDSLNEAVEKLQAENAALKLKGSIFTVSKRETELERQLESERMRADELSEQLQTLQVRYDEASQAVSELTDKLENIQNGAGKTFHEIGLMPEISEEEAEKIFFNKETKQEGTEHDNT